MSLKIEGKRIAKAAVRVGALAFALSGLGVKPTSAETKPPAHDWDGNREKITMVFERAGEGFLLYAPNGGNICGNEYTGPLEIGVISNNPEMKLIALGRPALYDDIPSVGGVDYPSRAASITQAVKDRAFQISDATKTFVNKLSIIYAKDRDNNQICYSAGIDESKPFVSETSAVSSTEARAQGNFGAGQAVGASGCSPAEQLGPWPKTNNGTLYNQELTAARGPVHAQLVFPGGPETSVIVESGNSFTVVGLQEGTAWDYPSEYNTPACRPVFDAEVAADEARRGDPRVRVEDLVTQRRFINRGSFRANPNGNAVVAANTAAATQAECKQVGSPNSYPLPTDVQVIGPAIVSAWGENDKWDQFDQGKEVRVAVLPSQRIIFVGVRGSVFQFTGCTDAQLSAERDRSAQAAGFPVTDIDALRNTGLVR